MAELQLKQAVKENYRYVILEKCDDDTKSKYKVFQQELHSIQRRICERRIRRENSFITFITDRFSVHFSEVKQLEYEKISNLLIEAYEVEEEPKRNELINIHRWHLSEFIYKLIKDGEINDELHPDFICLICIRRPISSVFLPCGHSKCCFNCAKTIEDKCQFCREEIDEVKKIYL